MAKAYRFDMTKYKKALDFSFNFYNNKYRKGFKAPYFTYLSSVSILIIENSGSTDEAIAGLLHDAYELNNGKGTVNQITKRFGNNVSNIIKQCSHLNNIKISNENWVEEKKKFIETIPKKSQSSLFVLLCDKLCSINCLINDHNKIGKRLWKHHIPDSNQITWYYKTLCKNLKKNLKNHKNLKDKFQRNVNELDYLTKK